MIKFSIRPFDEANTDPIIQIFRLNVPIFFSPLEEKDLVHYLAKEREDYFVVESKQQLVGAGGINYSGRDIAVLSWDFFHPDYQKKGLGTALVDHRLNHIRDNSDIQTVKVRTSQHTWEFYEKMGFTLVQKKPDFWAEGYHLFEMEMRL